MDHVSIEDFVQSGHLQEVNRLYFHPRGMALEVSVNDDGDPEVFWLSGVQDHRGDPEGIIFDELTTDEQERARRLHADYLTRAEARRLVLGYDIQPIEGTE